MPRLAIVTGGGRGIGAQICRVLAQAGLVVVAADIDEDAARATAATLPGDSPSRRVRGRNGRELSGTAVRDGRASVWTRRSPGLQCRASSAPGRQEAVYPRDHGRELERNFRGQRPRHVPLLARLPCAASARECGARPASSPSRPLLPSSAAITRVPLTSPPRRR